MPIDDHCVFARRYNLLFGKQESVCEIRDGLIHREGVRKESSTKSNKRCTETVMWSSRKGNNYQLSIRNQYQKDYFGIRIPYTCTPM